MGYPSLIDGCIDDWHGPLKLGSGHGRKGSYEPVKLSTVIFTLAGVRVKS